MANPIIQSTQVGPGAGAAGQGRNDLLTGVVVNLSDTNGANVGATYSWVFLDLPVGSGATITGASTATPSFTPDVAGSYWLRATVAGSATGTSNEILSAPLANTGARIPAFGEQTEYDGGGNSKGWHEALDEFMRAADAGIGGGGAPTGAAGGDLGGTYPNPTVERLGTSGAAVDVGSASPPTTGQALIATSATAATWQTTPPVADTIVQAGSWWGAPVSPNALDDEFTTDTSGSWTTTTLSGTAIDPYVTVSSGGSRVDWGVSRKSHLIIQPQDSTSVRLFKAATIDTNCFLYMKAVGNWGDQNVTGTQQNNWGVYLSDDGTLSSHYMLAYGMTVLSGGSSHVAAFLRKDSGGTSTVGSTQAGTNKGPYDIEFVGIQKIGSVYHGWAMRRSGGWAHMGSHTFSGNTLDTVGMAFYEDGGTPGTTLSYVDFFRYESGIVAPLR